jgi:protein-S-isoprenylcysteine O-methyltransferase Ste14
MYSAIFLMFVGMGLLAANWFIGAAGLLAFLLIMLSRVSREEEMMVNAFGDQYRRYASTTGRFFPHMRSIGQGMIE